MKSTVLLLSMLLTVNSLWATDPDSVQMQKYHSLFGSTGCILTPDAYTTDKWSGSIGIFENIESSLYDRVVFLIGVHEHIEVGIQSHIPSDSFPQMNFHFKIRGNDQGNYFGLFKSKLIPAMSFGINRNSAFAVATYGFKKVNFSAGYNFSDRNQSFFGNLNYQPFKFVALQGEYVSDALGLGFRFRHKGISASLLYFHDLKQNGFTSQNTYINIAYYFNS